MKFTTIIVFLIPVVVARHNHRTVLESILKSKDNMYVKVENDVQKVLNSLFDNLSLVPTFLAKSRNKLLLTMHYDLNSMAEKNYEVFEKLEEAARPDNGNESTKGLALFKLIEKTLNDKSLNLSAKENKTPDEPSNDKNKIDQDAASISSQIKTSLEDINPSDPVFADSKEFKKFIKDFIKKVNKLNESDFSKPTPLLPPIEHTTLPNIDVWEPPALDNSNTTRRIFGGKRSRAKTYPFVASIHLMGTFVCGGSIISSDLVLTAASCLQILHNNRFFRENPRAVHVRIGSDYFSRRGELIPVFESYFHPSYNPRTLANNLVLLRLMRHISFKRKEQRVKRIEYDRTSAHLSVNTDGIVIIGWGSRKHNNVIDQYERMMVARLGVYQIDECAQIYSKQYVTNKHFCAGYVSTGGGACNKDLGGPGVAGGLLVGVVSFGAPLCGAIDAPTVFTKVGYYAKWIDSIVEQNGLSIMGRTTISSASRYFFDTNNLPKPHRTTRGDIEPLLMFPEESEPEEEYKHVVKRRMKNRNRFVQLVPNTTTTTRFPIHLYRQKLKSITYDDYDAHVLEDVNEMFKTTRKVMKAIEHPLVNKSLVPIPGVHDILTPMEKYSTVRLTSAFGWDELSPEGPTASQTRLTERTTPQTSSHRIIDLLTVGSPTGPEQDWPRPKTTVPISEESEETTTEPAETEEPVPTTSEIPEKEEKKNED